jgi:hypothetical protein
MSLSDRKFGNARLGRDNSWIELSFSSSAAEEQAVPQGVCQDAPTCTSVIRVAVPSHTVESSAITWRRVQCHQMA